MRGMRIKGNRGPRGNDQRYVETGVMEGEKVKWFKPADAHSVSGVDPKEDDI